MKELLKKYSIRVVCFYLYKKPHSHEKIFYYDFPFMNYFLMMM